MTPVIRAAGFEDVPELEKLAARCATVFDLETLTETRLIDLLSDERAVVYIAEEDGSGPVGFVVGILISEPRSSTLAIRVLALSPEPDDLADRAARNRDR